MNILWSRTPKHILTMIVDHRIISSANNTALLTLRYCLECIHVSIYAQVKAWANSFIKTRATTRICAKKPFIVIDYNCHCFGFGQFPINNCVLYSPGWINLKTTIKAEILPLNFVNDQSVTFFCSQWMSFGQNLLQLVFWKICETCNLRVFFGFIFVACCKRT